MSQKKFLVIAGPCVIEDEALVQEVASELKRQFEGLPIDFCFKASFDKANRTSIHSFRGPGLQEGLRVLEGVKSRLGLSVLTDVHTVDQCERVARSVDVLQVPAFLCRQTDLVEAAVRSCLKYDRRLNIKKGQFLAPWDAKNIVGKVREIVGSTRDVSEFFTLTERGTSFGYNRLVVDMSGIPLMQAMGVRVVMDATHSVQLPGAAPGGGSTGGERWAIETLARAAMATGADGVFMEVHPRPDLAKSDGPNALPLEKAGNLVRQLLQLHELAKTFERIVPL